jgi:predicted permease
MWTRLRNKVRFLRRRAHFDRELSEELDFHREMLALEKVRNGLHTEAAVTAARRQLGNTLTAREDARDSWISPAVENTVRDLRFAVRACLRSPGFSLTIVLTLALGIGANAAIFQVLDAVVFRSLPVRSPEELLRLQGFHDGKPASFSYPLYKELAARQDILEGVFATVDIPAPTVVVAGSEPLRDVAASLVTGDYFGLLGVDAQFGRVFGSLDDQPSAPPVAVLSHAFSQRMFGNGPAGIGQHLRINNLVVTAVGVTRAGFFGERVGSAPDVWLPMSRAPELELSWLLQPSASMLLPMGRLRPDVPRVQADIRLDALYRQLAGWDIKTIGVKERRLQTQPGAKGIPSIQNEVASPLFLLMGLVGFVVLIASCNLASLSLARSSARAHEIAVRVALGATRPRLVGALLTESLLLSAVGGVAALFVGSWGSAALVALATPDEPWRLSLETTWRVVVVAALLSVLAAGLFGLAPALKMTLATPPLMAGRLRARTGAQAPRRLAKGFVIAQLAISLILVASASLLARSFWNLTHQDVGYQEEGVLLVRLPFDLANLKLTRDGAFRSDLERRVNEVPGVISAALSGAGPLGSMQRLGKVALPGHATAAVDDARFVAVSFRYFDTMGIRIVAGRSLTDADRLGSPRVAIISETAARRLFGQESAVGREFTPGDHYDPGQTVRIVGVARDVRFANLRDPFGAVVYQPLQQAPAPLTSIAFRTTGDAADFVKSAEAAVRHAAPGLKIADTVTLRQVLRSSVAQDWMVATISSGFALVALLLAGVGLYGVTAYGIAQRTPEIGLRLALGGSPRQIVLHLLAESAIVLWIGLAIGGVGTLLLGRLITSMLFGLTVHDPVILCAATGSLVAATMVAGYLAARHAARLDPMCALRHN